MRRDLRNPMATTSKSSFVPTYSQKLASIFARHSASSVHTHHVFPFTSLPYDIRVIIYSYLETDAPLTPRTHSLGLYQACRQTRIELDELAHEDLRSLCAKMEKTSCFDVAIKLDSDNLRHVTVTLPYAAFDTQESKFHKPKWQHDVLTALYPLFALHLDTLRVHISSFNCSELSVPKQNTLEDRLHLQNTMCRLISDIASMIVHQNHYLPQENSADYSWRLDRIFTRSAGEHCMLLPTYAVHAKRICLSWDLRALSTNSMNLVGRMHHVTETAARAARILRHRQLRSKTTKNMTSGPKNRTIVSAYYLRDSQHLVGEVGVASLSGWVLNDPLWVAVSSLIGNVMQNGHVISSKGLGEECQSGLGVVGKNEFEEVEKTVAMEREKMHRERIERQIEEMYMAYLEEGIMID
jgi:hypothetical protein